jgi:very-short-patch-repair endonuclease
VDFYNHEFKLVIEIDGEIHESEQYKNYDSRRTNELEKLGIKVLRFTNHQVIYSIDSTIDAIHKEILLSGQSPYNWHYPYLHSRKTI